MALKTHRYGVCTELQNLKDTNTHIKTNKQPVGENMENSDTSTDDPSRRGGVKRQETEVSEVRLPSERPESTEAPCRRISLRWSHRPVVTTSWPPHLTRKICDHHENHHWHYDDLLLYRTVILILCLKEINTHLSYGRAQVAAPPPSLSGTCGTQPAHRWEESGWTVAPQSTLPKGKHANK